MDNLLLPFLQAKEAGEADRLLAQLVFEHADPIIRPILWRKLHVYLDKTGRSSQSPSQDVEDVYCEARAQLLTRLTELKANPTNQPISNLRSYVAVVAYNACHEYLRKKYPKRHSLKNQIRYRLEHHPSFACWEGQDREWLCGFAVWRNQKKAVPPTETRSRLSGNLRAFHQDAWSYEDVQRMSDADLLAAIFKWMNGPIALDDLVNRCAELRGIKDEMEPVPMDAQSPDNPYHHLPDPRDPMDVELARRIYLQRLWTEICQLLPRQRAALLLNLRDAQGSSAIDLFTITGLSIRQIAEALDMSAEQLARLWNDLPLDDTVIAQHLRVTRQQVINLRKSARERLARRMRALGGEP